jgi:hypothetical protein
MSLDSAGGEGDASREPLEPRGGRTAAGAVHAPGLTG